jgi:hypothetical protein
MKTEQEPGLWSRGSYCRSLHNYLTNNFLRLIAATAPIAIKTATAAAVTLNADCGAKPVLGNVGVPEAAPATVNNTALETPTPGFVTLTGAYSEVVNNVEGTVAVSSVGDTYVVANEEPANEITDPLIKPDPMTVIAADPLPIVTWLGETEVMNGVVVDAAVTVKAAVLELPAPELNTPTLKVPDELKAAAGKAATN